MNIRVKPYRIDEYDESLRDWSTLYAGLDEAQTEAFFRDLDAHKSVFAALRFVTPTRQVVSPAGRRAYA